MSFKIVSIQKEKKPKGVYSGIRKKDAIKGTISYIDDSALNAMFLYNKNGESFIVPIVTKTISIIGRKYCYCRYKATLLLTAYVRYLPEEPFKTDCKGFFKFKNGQDVYAVIKNNKAYVVSK